MWNFDDKTKFDENGLEIGKHNNYAINAHKCHTNMEIGARGCGKTFPVLVMECVKKFIDSGYHDQFAYVRRRKEERIKNQRKIFNGVVKSGWIEWYTSGEWDSIYFYQGNWFLRKTNENGEEEARCPNPMGWAFDLSTSMNDKGPDYPDVRTIVFDEFIPLKGATKRYLTDEVDLWLNLISTIDRGREQCTIYMLANSIDPNGCPYFDYYGIDPDMLEQGKIYVSNVTKKGKIAIEYCKEKGQGNADESVYFKVDDEVGAMIINGAWDINRFPSLPKNYLDDIDNITIMTFFIYLKQGKIIRGRFLSTNTAVVYFDIYPEDKIPYDSMLYVDQWYNDAIDDPRIRVGFSTSYKLDSHILDMIQSNRAYYESDSVGAKIQNFLGV